MARSQTEKRWESIKPNCPEAWEEFCGFLTLSINEYMTVQERLMQEQLQLWCPSGIGKHVLKGDDAPATIQQFRKAVPLTTYDDYADVLLQKRADMLPAPAVTWVETTWEGGKRPIKVAPYTQGIVDTFRRNSKSVMLLASASDWGKFTLGTNALQGLAPLPYLTGLMGLFLEQDFHFKTMPPCKTASTMRFSERTKLGFKTALSCGVDYFFGLGSISYFMSKQLTKSKGSGSSKLPVKAVARYLRAKNAAKKDGRDMVPSDLFQLTGFICAGTDNACYKDDLEKLWGVRPMELFAGTECSLVGTETWNRKDLYFFPDCCYYEFLPIKYVRLNDPHMPTVTMDQVQPNEKYELVATSFKGGAFARYRTGDVYLCTGIGEAADRSTLPRFRYIDRVPTIIDIAGFTRITENSIADVIELSRLPIARWCAAKEFERETGHPYLHMCVEMDPKSLDSQAVNENLMRQHLGIYFNYLDSDYDSLKRILEMEPLQITFLRNGTFDAFEQEYGRSIFRINPPADDMHALQALQEDRKGADLWGALP